MPNIEQERPAPVCESCERLRAALERIVSTAPWSDIDGHNQCLIEARKALAGKAEQSASGSNDPDYCERCCTSHKSIECPDNERRPRNRT